MKKTLYIFSLLFALFALGGCSQPNELFGGTDNGLTSFSITANGVTYQAAIVGSQIILSVPVGADLSAAKVEYQLCEQATIVPDPSTISDWGSEHVFRIKSHSKDPRQYTYTVRRTDVSKAGNVQLLTQSDVENFAKLGITVVDGNLTIGSDSTPMGDSIVNVEALSSIKEVRYNIIVKHGFTGGTLKGLQNIERCGGLHIGTLTSQIEFSAQSGISIDMPMLQSVGDVVLNSNSIKSLTFETLASASSIYIASNSLSALKLPALRETVGNLAFDNNSRSVNSILSQISLPKLEKVGGNLSLRYFSGVSDLNVPRLSYVGGDVVVALNSGVLEQLAFSELTTIDGVFVVEYAPGLIKLSIPKVKELTSFIFNKDSYGTYPLQTLDLASLETITEDIYLRGVAVESLTFANLKNVGGEVTFWDLKFATEILMPSISHIGEKLYLYSPSSLETLDISSLDTLSKLELIGCSALTKMKTPSVIGDIVINYASQTACPTPEFMGLQRVDGVISFSSDYNTKTFDIAHIKTIGTLRFGGGASGATLNLIDVEKIGTFELSSSNIETLNAPKLREVSNLKFSYISKLTTLTIPTLKTVGSFSLSEHNSWGTSSARMTDLSAYRGLTSIGSVTISYCAKLVDFSALAGVIPMMDAAKWSVSNCGYNPTYLDMVNGAVKP